MPVEVSVAASLRAMRPDLPTPDTMTRPPRGQQPHGPGEPLIEALGRGRHLGRLQLQHPAAGADERRPQTAPAAGSEK